MSSVSNGLKHLAQTMEALETNGKSVTEFATTAEENPAESNLTARFSVVIPSPLESEGLETSCFSATEARVSQDGSIQISFEGEIPESEAESSVKSQRANRQSEDKDDGIPPHRDPEMLRAAYEECDTFVEMRESLGTNVTAEAVRQQMVKHGIHEVSDASTSDDDQDNSVASSLASPDQPDSNTQGEQAPSGEIFVSDGGVPPGLTLEKLTSVVKTSHTLYGAAQELEMDQNGARDLFNRLNLLDLVTGRLSTKDEITVTSDEIDRRIQASGVVPS